MRYDVFLSHNSADKPAVELIARRLRDEAGLAPFLDKWHLVPGESWQEALEQAADELAEAGSGATREVDELADQLGEGQGGLADAGKNQAPQPGQGGMGQVQPGGMGEGDQLGEGPGGGGAGLAARE